MMSSRNKLTPRRNTASAARRGNDSKAPGRSLPADSAAQTAASMGSSQSTSWGGVAEWYDRLLGGAGTFQQEVILPNLLRLMAITKGEKIADIACGQGFFSAAFLKAGAEVIGADLAEELIAKARQNVPHAKFFAAPSDRLDELKDGWADHATMILAIQNMENDRAAVAECARVLRHGGKLHLVLNHPAFRIPKRSAWGWDYEAKRQYRRLDGYLTESRTNIAMAPGSDPKLQTISFHRPLQHYVKILSKAGLAVTGLEEWLSDRKSDSGPRAAEENRTRREFPLFLYLQATKL